MNRKLSALLKRGNLSGQEAGWIYVLSQIDRINLHSLGPDKYKPYCSAEDVQTALSAVSKTKQDLRALSAYQSLGTALISIYNYSQSAFQQSQHGHYKLIGQLQKHVSDLSKANIFLNLPMLISNKELEATKKKSLEAVRSRKLSLSQAWLRYINDAFQSYVTGKRGFKSELERALEAPVTDSYLCGLRCNQCTITEGGIEINALTWPAVKKIVFDEIKRNLYKHHKTKSEKKLLENIHHNVQEAICEYFSDSEAFISSLSDYEGRPIGKDGIARTLANTLTASGSDAEIGDLEGNRGKGLDVLLSDYVSLFRMTFVKDCQQEAITRKSVLEKVFDCVPLKHRFKPYYNGLKVRDIVAKAEESTGGTQEGFNAFLRYIDGLEPLFTGEEEKALFKTLKDPKATAKACSTMSTVGELADKGDPYSLSLLAQAVSQDSILEQFRKDNPIDPRAYFHFESYIALEKLHSINLWAYEDASRNEIDKLRKDPEKRKDARDTIEKILAPACSILLSCKRFLEGLAEIYNVPELTKANIRQWQDMESALDRCVGLILVAFFATDISDTLDEKRRSVLRETYTPIFPYLLEPKEQITAILSLIKKDPYSDTALSILSELPTTIQNLSRRLKLRKDKQEEEGAEIYKEVNS